MQVLMLGGFLGAGKSSILLQLARYMGSMLPTGGTPLAVLENEIGDVSIDGLLLEQRGLTVKNLFAGCICCTLSGDLVAGLNEIAQQYAPAWVFIETTGLAFPGRIVDTIEKYAPACKGLRVATVVDAERFEELIEDVRPLMEGQIMPADVLLLNKADLVDEGTLEKVTKELSALNGAAAVLPICAKDELERDVLQAVMGVEA